MNAWDLSLLLQINTVWSHPVLDWLMPALSAIEAWLPFIVLAVLITAWRGGKRARVMLLCAGIAIALGDGVISNTLKKTIGRVRPRDAVSGVIIRDLGFASPAFMRLFQQPVVQAGKPVPHVASPSRPAIPSTCSPSPRSSHAFIAAPALPSICWLRPWHIHASTAARTGPATFHPQWPSEF